MKPGQLLTPLLKDGINLNKIEDGIYSVLPLEDRVHVYDSKVAIYDLIIGSSIYNRLVWGNTLSNYRDFCLSGLESSDTGIVLDVGCGSLVFTHKTYSQYTDRPVILLDRSLGMLTKARERLTDKLGKYPDNYIFIQGDALDLPFVDYAFETVLSFGMLHIFEDMEKFMGELLRVKSEKGKLFTTSLAGNNRFAKKYLNLLEKNGEVGAVHTSDELAKRLSTINTGLHISSIANMAYVTLR